MKKSLFTLILALLTLCFSAALASAQNTSGVTGIVKDSTGAVVAGADVKLSNPKTGTELTTKTNDQGVYSFNKVAPGEGYTITVTASGFQTLIINDVALGVANIETHNAELTIGEVSGTVVVTASNEVTLNTTDASIGNVISERRLKELPIQIRSSPAALISLQPGVVGNNVGTTSTNRVGSVTGSRADQGNITVDGIDANDQATGQFAATVGNAPIDAIQEFRAVSTNPAASEGRSSGGQVELVTKSGTNDFHGNLYEYNRTAKTAANSFFNNRSGIARPQLTRNQFGGSIGGPIMKDALFFFFNYEGRRDAQGVSYLRVVPLDTFRNGGLAYINANAGCSSSSRANTTPSCISVLTPAQVAALDPKGIGGSSALLSFLNSRYPHANDLTAGDGINTGGFRFNAPSHRKDNTYTTRMDWNATSKQKVFGRFNIARRQQTDTVNTVAAQFPGDPEPGQIVVKDYSWVVGHTWTATTNLVNQATVGASRSGLLFPNNFEPAFPNSFTFGMGLAAPYASISDQDRFVLVPTIRDDVTWTRGIHTWQFGGSFKPIDSKSGITNDFNFPTVGIGGLLGALEPSLRPANINGNNTNTTVTGNYDAALTFLLGRLAQIGSNYNYDTSGTPFAAGTGKHRDYKYNETELYVQDNWRVRNNLTVNLGVRWHLYPAPYEADGFQAAQDVDMRQLFDLRQRNNARGIAGDSAEPLLRYDLIGKANNGRSLYETDLNNFAPRFGFAYTPSYKEGLMGKIFGENKTSIRGGGSVVYDRPGGGITFIQDQVSYLFDNSATSQFGGRANATLDLLSDPRFVSITTLPVNNTPPTITRPFTPFVDGGVPFGLSTGELNYAVDQRFRTPYSIQYSFGFQRELPGNFILEASYVGRQSRKLFSQADLSQALDFKDPASGQSMFGAFNTVQASLLASTNAGLPLATIIANVPNQPWIENQLNAALLANFGGTCQQLAGSSCTNLEVRSASARQFLLRGDSSDLVQLLNSQGRLLNNVGMGAQFGTNIYISNQGSASYDGMLVSLRKRFSQGLQFDFNYTWSHSIDNGSSVVNTVTGGLVCDLTNLRVCRGPSDFDIRHLVNANFIYELPFGKGQRFFNGSPGWVNQIIGGWEVSGIATARSGLPFSTTTTAFPVGFNFNSPAGLNSSSIGALQENIHDSGSSIQFFNDPLAVFNPAKPLDGVVRFPHHGEIGNRNFFRGPGFWNLDTAVLKTFKMPWEGHTLQIRWESFNVFNHNAFSTPTVGITGTTFGTITSSASSPREMQFAFRYQF